MLGKGRPRVEAGSPYPLGATWDGYGVNFALFSANASAVELCLFDGPEGKETQRIALPEYTDEVWHGYLPDARPGTVYGYRVHGRHAPKEGHRFNANKLLLDPYARAHTGRVKLAPELYGYVFEGGDPGSFDERDSASSMPRCVVTSGAARDTRGGKPAVPWGRTILYEAHVRGFTMRHPAVPEALRGTFAGMAVAEVVEHLRGLGITAVELLPVHASADEPSLVRRGLANYWGYNTAGFFVPDHRLAADPARAAEEFRALAAHLHEAGIEVVLDVVYNHTAEGDETGPTLSFRGIDNASYYRLRPEDRSRYGNDTGCGNTLDFSHPRTVQLAMDSLRYWAEDMGADGFRFDLATVLAREADGFDRGSGFLDACRQDPVLSQVKLIAEPWDIGPGGYQVGGFPPGWAEWNDKFRDAVRAFWRGDEHAAPGFAAALCASAERFRKSGRRPWSSVNYVCSHDGFTLRDLVSYERKHNEANGEGNRDGTDNNLSSNHGAEGETVDPAIGAARRKTMRNLLATLLIAQGTPMLLAGDEIGRTQRGNNNAYCQDTALSWVSWGGPSWASVQLRFVQALTRLRARFPVLRRTWFLTGEAVDGVKDVTWIGPDGHEMRGQAWGDPALRCFGMLLDGRARPAGPSWKREASALAVFNAGSVQVPFMLPSRAGLGADQGEWEAVLDTDRDGDGEGRRCRPGEAWAVAPRSLLLFVAQA